MAQPTVAKPPQLGNEQCLTCSFKSLVQIYDENISIYKMKILRYIGDILVKSHVRQRYKRMKKKNS